MSHKSRMSSRAVLLESIAQVRKLAHAEHEASTPMELAVRTRLDVDSVGNAAVQRTVFCPQRRHSVDVATCSACARAILVPGNARSGSDVVCATEQPATRKHDAAESAMRTLVGEVARRPLVCVPKDAPWETLEDLLVGMKHDVLVVVDAAARPCGIVTATDLLLCPREDQSPTEAIVLEPGFHVETRRCVASDIMTPVTHTMIETTPLSFAVSLLGSDEVKAIPVIDAKGIAIGIISATDVTRWLASLFGYEPARNAQSARK